MKQENCIICRETPADYTAVEHPPRPPAAGPG